MATSDDLDKYSGSWSLESDHPNFRGTCSIVVAVISIYLLIRLFIQIVRKTREDPLHAPEVCKYCSLCCGSRRSDQCCDCAHFCVLPAPLDVALCIFFFGFFCFLGNGCGIIFWGSWVDATETFWGRLWLYVFAVLIGFVSLCSYLYFYAMLLNTISAAGDDFAVGKCIKGFHVTLIALSGVLLPTGNIMMELFGQDFGRIFRIGQGLAYTSFACVFLGMAHLIIILITKLELVLVNSMSSDLVSRAHEKSRTEIRRDVNDLAKTQAQRDAHLINVITKLLVITVTILIISFGTGIITGFRYYFADQEELARGLSLARWAWFTMINISFGAFCIYLTIGFNYELYKFWCRCDNAVHQCILCCIKRDTVRRVTRVSISQSQAKLASIPSSTGSMDTMDTMDTSTAENTKRNTGKGFELKMSSIPSSSPGPVPSMSGGIVSTSEISSNNNKVTITPQTTNTGSMIKTMPSNSKMVSYSSMQSGSDTGIDSMDENEAIQTQSTVHIGGVPQQASIEEGPEEEERVYDLQLKMSDLANNVEMTGLKSSNNNDGYHQAQNTADSVSIHGYTANGIMHMASEQL